MTIKFIAISFILLGLVFLLWRKWIIRLLHLWFISVRYGKYSHEFCSFFKDNDMVSPYIACLKDQITSHFVIFIRKLEDSLEFQTNSPIDYEGIPFMVNTHYVIKHKGTPECVNVASLSDIKFLVMGYNEYIHGIKMKSMYFFVNDHFVMGEFLFSDLKHTSTSALIETISSKYLNGKVPEKEFFYIKDKDGNQLNFENNGFSISIKYLFRGDQTTNHILTESYLPNDNRSERTLAQLRNEELLDRL